MKTLQRINVAPERQQQATHGTSLSSNYVPPSLENKYLVQTSTLMPQLSSSSCPSLQPSSLSSTSSTLLSASSSSSSLLSTHNKLLNSDSSRLSFSLTSSTSIPSNSLLSTSLASGALLNRFANPPSFLHPSTHVEQKEEDGGGHDGREEISEAMQCCFEETKLPVLETEMSNQEHDQTLVSRQEEFAEIDGRKEATEDELKDKKYLLLNAVCCSLVNKCMAPGQKDWDMEYTVWTRIKNLAKDISVSDPEFLLKVAVYTRQKLNIRITANFLLALAANQPSTKPHVRRYFCAAVQLPSDWLEVVRIYSACFSRSLPACLKKAMADKFKQFSEYQLAKYNTRKHRCKHNRNRRKNKLEAKKVVTVDKKQSEFSMKKMIEKLHIKEPAEHVMAVLGRKYPADVKAFTRSGMKGVWDRTRAGQRMKLKQPETWERLLSLEGNKAATWEKLIDNKSLPFMAMLRNLRNMITQGISEAHHQKILNTLTNKKAVIQSRQFPFRFLAAYKVIAELQTLASASQQAIPSVKEILKDILKNIPKSKRFKRLDWENTERKRMRVALGVPFIYRLYRSKKAQFIKANQRQFTVALLDRYCKALETAVQISCRYNVPPLPGRTLILLCVNERAKSTRDPKHDFCLPPDPECESEEKEEKEEEEEDKEEEEVEEQEEEEEVKQEEEDKEEEEEEEEQEEEEKVEEQEEEEDKEEKQEQEEKKDDKDDKLTPTKLEVAVLLSLMIGSSAEDSQLCLVDNDDAEEVELKSDVLLDNVRSVVKQTQAFRNKQYTDKNFNFFFRTFTKKNKVDNIIMVTEGWIPYAAEWSINTYRQEVNDKALLVQLSLSEGSPYRKPDRNSVKLEGFSEQMLRFVAERGSSRLLDHVENLDKVYNIPPPEGAKGPQPTNNVISIPSSPNLRWRGVRVFISSTFRDMHSERNILVRSVFPELRRRAAQHRLHLQEVELRWGVTEEESDRTTELCLSEVCRSQMLVGILGESLHIVVSHGKLASALAGLSITEMEIRQFQALYPDTAHQRMFCYFRDPNIIKSVPVAWRSDFAPESKEAETKMTSLKRRIQTSDVKVTENYSCEWGGVVDGKPYLKNLEDFGKAVLEDLWTAVVKRFEEKGDEAEAASDVMEQEVHQGALQRQFFGRAKLLSGAAEKVEEVQAKGGMMVVDGAPGEGKTVFMAALADALRTGVKSRRNLVCDVISYSTAASQSARSAENLLRCLVQSLRKMKDAEEESPFPVSYKDLLSDFHSALSDVMNNRPLVLLVDGVDLVRDARGQLNLDWIPQQFPKGVCLVVSAPSNSALLQTLAKKKGTLLFPLGQLTMPDRKEIVQKGLDAFGKKLSDSAFNNQLQTLTMKKGAVSPLYLHLACEDLRNFASFDKLKESLHGLPQSLSQLVQFSLDRLCTLYRGMLGLRWALAALTVSTTGLRERDLYSVLNTCNDLFSRDGQVTWHEVLHLSRKPKGRIPMATFTRMVQSLQSLIGLSQCHNTDNLLTLNNPEIQSDQLEALRFLLSSYYFLYANVRNGLLHHLLETYSLYALFIQQALNEPSETSAHTWAHGLVGKGGVRVVEWLNNNNQIAKETSELVSTFLSEPTCVVVSLDGELMVVGTAQGTLHFIDTQTGQEVKSLMSSCDGISSCVFLKDGRLASTSFDGRIEIWDIENGCRTALINGHTSVITASDITADRKHLATVSLDFMLKVWSSAKGHEVAALFSTSPLNCVTFDPEDRLLAAGCWDGNVIVWNWLQNKAQTSLSGHQRSVRSLSFSPSSSMLCSGSVSGEVRVWSVPTSTCVGCFQAHFGATEALTFLDEGSMLLSAGADHMEPPQKKLKCVTAEPAALCVAVNGDHVAVGYHGDGIKLFCLNSGKEIWACKLVDVSILSLLWVLVDAEQTAPELLVSAGGDKRLRLWKRKGGDEGLLGGLTEIGKSAVQSGVILALAQNSTHLATASDNFTIALWSLSCLDIDSCVEPQEVLRGHSGGVTCLAFSPDGGQLLSGGKDQALMLWDVTSSPAVLSKSLPHSHRDWITGCVWTPDCVGRQVIAGCAEGALHVWNWDTSIEICHIAAHKQHIHHCCLLPNADENKEVNPEEMTVFTASDDGTVQLWKPLQVEHFGTFQGHSGAIHGVVRKEGAQEFLTVSEDCSLRCWTQTINDTVTAICFMPDGQFAVSYMKLCVDLWKLVWNHQHNTARWDKRVRILSLIRNDEKSIWLMGEREGDVTLGFMFAMGSQTDFYSSFGHMELKCDEQENKGSLVTAVTVDKGTNKLIFSSQLILLLQAHSDRISVLRVTDSTIISGSYDRTVKMWDRNTKKQDRYANMELECDGGGGGGGGGVAFSLHTIELVISIHAADSRVVAGNKQLSPIVTHSYEGSMPALTPQGTLFFIQTHVSISAGDELSKSSDSLTDNNNTKDKGGVFKGMFKKTTKEGPQQDLLENELLASNDSLSENTNTKDDLSAPSEQPSSNDNLSVNHNAKETGGMFGGMFKKSPKPFGARTQSQDMVDNNCRTFASLIQDDLSAPSELSGSNDNLSENNTKEKGGIFSGVFKKPKLLGAKSQDDLSADNELSASSDSLAEKPSKNGFSAMMKSTFYADKQSAMVGVASKLNPFRSANKKDTEDTETLKETEEKPKLVKSNMIHQERKERSETPLVPPRPTEEEMKGTSTYDKVKTRDTEDIQVNKDMISTQKKEKPAETPVRASEEVELAFSVLGVLAAQNQSDDEGLKEDTMNPAESKTTKVKKSKQHNPFMLRSAAKESLDLMEWWNTVEAWEDTPQKEDMTEKEEAKAFAVTADKVQKGIRVFNKLFTERAESLWQHVIDLNGIADSLDKFNKNTKIAQITGGSTSAIGGVATIAGLALAPVTMGTSLIVTAVGLGVATAGGLTSAGAGISNQVNNSMDRKKVEKIVQDYQEKMADLNKCLTFIKQGIENLHKFDLIKMKNHGYNRDFPVLSSSFYEDGAMVGKAILINANEIMRVVQIANVAGSTAARAVQIASMATGVLTGLFVGMDIYFVAKDSKELKKGAKSEFAAKIRDVATQLHDGLVELNGLRDELQSSSTRENDTENDAAALDRDKKKEDENNDSSEDEIDRIKKAIKKDIENREYV
ncbi:hypothetical protein PAMA_004735 [Pampus argenteus]